MTNHQWTSLKQKEVKVNDTFIAPQIQCGLKTDSQIRFQSWYSCCCFCFSRFFSIFISYKCWIICSRSTTSKNLYTKSQITNHSVESIAEILTRDSTLDDQWDFVPSSHLSAPQMHCTLNYWFQRVHCPLSLYISCNSVSASWEWHVWTVKALGTKEAASFSQRFSKHLKIWSITKWCLSIYYIF